MVCFHGDVYDSLHMLSHLNVIGFLFREDSLSATVPQIIYYYNHHLALNRNYMQFQPWSVTANG